MEVDREGIGIESLILGQPVTIRGSPIGLISANTGFAGNALFLKGQTPPILSHIVDSPHPTNYNPNSYSLY
jgi:hypothetical protein